MELQKSTIELRSEKVNNIIGQIPPMVVRIGISFLSVVLMLIIFTSTLVEHNTIVDVTAEISEDESKIIFNASDLSQIKNGLIVEIDLNQIYKVNCPLLRLEIQSVEKTITISSVNSFCKASISQSKVLFFLKSHNLKIKDKVQIPCKITIKKESLFGWIFHKINL
ncbi:MAG: hypothetical protein WCK02_15740 [Bacteroidota bacterium]